MDTIEKPQNIHTIRNQGHSCDVDFQITGDAYLSQSRLRVTFSSSAAACILPWHQMMRFLRKGSATAEIWLRSRSCRWRTLSSRLRLIKILNKLLANDEDEKSQETKPSKNAASSEHEEPEETEQFVIRIRYN